ncbi:hypothetical protein L6R52_00360 [Myxococcota bacterium]|nr:hypothetical protein [Myxococcota bacterium]
MSRAYALSILFALQLGCGSSCGPTTPGPSTECETAIPVPARETVILGRLDGASAFVPLVDGDVLPRHFGSQGGQHVELAVRLYADAGAVWVHELSLWADAELQVGGTSERVDACAPGWSTTSGVILQFWGDVGSSTAALARIELVSRRFDAPEHVVEAEPIAIGISE